MAAIWRHIATHSSRSSKVWKLGRASAATDGVRWDCIYSIPATPQPAQAATCSPIERHTSQYGCDASRS